MHRSSNIALHAHCSAGLSLQAAGSSWATTIPPDLDTLGCICWLEHGCRSKMLPMALTLSFLFLAADSFTLQAFTSVHSIPLLHRWWLAPCISAGWDGTSLHRAEPSAACLFVMYILCVLIAVRTADWFLRESSCKVPKHVPERCFWRIRKKSIEAHRARTAPKSWTQFITAF